MKVIKRGDKYRPAIGEHFVLVYRGKRHLVKMERENVCKDCPLCRLSIIECNQYVDCMHFSLDYHLIPIEEEIE